MPFTPAEIFVKWTEFAAAFDDLRELNLASADMNFITYSSLDVIVPAALPAAVLLYVILKVFLKCMSMLVHVRKVKNE